jgi:Family of unknown function (DUF5681)
MELASEIEVRSEQREEAEDLPALQPEQPPAPRGRPWVKGQSGNPAGRPPRAHMTATVAEYLIGRKTIPLTKKLVALALAGDRAALRLCFERIAPPRRDAQEWRGLPLVEDRVQVRALIGALSEAVEQGAITPAQSDALVSLAKTIVQMS